jgi:hypothetical protein
MRRYRFACMIVEGDGAKMRTVEIGSSPTERKAKAFLAAHRAQNGISPKRVGIFDRKRQRWADMPWVLHS